MYLREVAIDCLPRLVAESSKWDQCLAEVADILARMGHPPSYGNQQEQLENTLATWFRTASRNTPPPRM